MNKPAVSILIRRRKRGTIFSVSRRNDPKRWGLPGGKVDAGETAKQAAARELFEETGVRVRIEDMVEVYSAACPGDVVYDVITYEVDYEKADFSQLRAEAGLALAWLTETELSNPGISPFAGYNGDLFAASNS